MDSWKYFLFVFLSVNFISCSKQRTKFSFCLYIFFSLQRQLAASTIQRTLDELSESPVVSLFPSLPKFAASGEKKSSFHFTFSLTFFTAAVSESIWQKDTIKQQDLVKTCEFYITFSFQMAKCQLPFNITEKSSDLIRPRLFISSAHRWVSRNSTNHKTLIPNLFTVKQSLSCVILSLLFWNNYRFLKLCWIQSYY